MRLITAFLVFLIVTSIHAESYRDIDPLDDLGAVKAKFPNATANRLTPGWAQPTDAMYQFTGIGMSGTIIVKFDDSRPSYKKELESGSATVSAELLQNLINQTDDEALTVSWVRWIPDSQIPLQRLISKYGKPEKSGFSDENFEPYRSWDKRGISVYLSDDEKFVQRIDFSFTKDEMRKAWLRKYKIVPYWLRDKPREVKKK